MKVFIEEQKFNQPLVIALLLLTFIGTIVLILVDFKSISESSIGEIMGAFSGLLIILLAAILFFILKLKTRIDEKGVYYQFYPFHFGYKVIPWETISTCYVRNYNAISEFGGWGMKFSFFKKRGKSFTTKGDIGLQIELKSGKKILIGTQKKEEIQRTIDTYKDKVAVNEY